MAVEAAAALGHLAALVGGLIALVTIPLVPAGVPILLAAFAVVPAYVMATRQR